MPAPATTTEVATLLKKSRLLSDDQIDEFLKSHTRLSAPADLLSRMRDDGLLTPFQAEQVMKGRHKGFVLGKYRLLDRIGMGGMGQVYLAEHVSMRRRVAVKVLPPNRSDNPFARERFLREARAAALLEHPNLVRAHDLEIDGDVTYLVMDYIEGATLHDLVMRRGPQPVVRVAHLLKMVCQGLSAIHERMLVHRDIKPANLHMDRAGVVRLLDLGLVRSELDDDALTRGEGARVVGTADYLAPEQAMESSKVDGRADLYSVGCTAYFLLTGEPPFTAEKLSQKLIAHQMSEAKPPHTVRPNVPVEFSMIVMKLLAKKPEQRYANAAEVIAALEPWTREPCPAPAPEDFPNRNEAVYGPTSMGLSLSSRVNIGAAPTLEPGLSGATSNIQATAPPPQSKVNTALNSEHDTLRDTPLPKLPPVAPIAAVATPPVAAEAKPVKKELLDSRVAALFGTPEPPSARGVGMHYRWLAVAAFLGLLAGGLMMLVLRK